MTVTRIKELAAAVNVDPAECLAPSEVVSFRLRPDGGVTTVTAGGEVLRCLASDDLPACIPAADVARHRKDVAKMLKLMAELVPGHVIAAGVTYVRRRLRIGDDKWSIIFSEAGR